MLRKIVLSTVAAATALTALPAAADAQPRYGHSGHGYNGRGYYGQSYRGYQAPRFDNRAYGNRVHAQRRYDGYGYGRYYGRRCTDDGAAGTIIGAIAGGLLGSSAAGRGDRAVGAIIGGGAGALIGNAIDSGDCRR